MGRPAGALVLMPRDWLTEEERAQLPRRERWMRIEAWAYGIGMGTLVLIGARVELGL